MNPHNRCLTGARSSRALAVSPPEHSWPQGAPKLDH
jgi:hypothetical protein